MLQIAEVLKTYGRTEQVTLTRAQVIKKNKNIRRKVNPVTDAQKLAVSEAFKVCKQLPRRKLLSLSGLKIGKLTEVVKHFKEIGAITTHSDSSMGSPRVIYTFIDE